jgi:hypothetical protein
MWFLRNIFYNVLGSIIKFGGRMTKSFFVLFTLFYIFMSIPLQVLGEDSNKSISTNPMTNERIDTLIRRLDDQPQGGKGFWSFKISNLSTTVVTDEKANRMRINIPIVETENIDNEHLRRIMQANVDSTLDARYAIAKNILWSAYIHPLTSLSDDDFLNGPGQTVNLVTNYGGSYSSGLLTFSGGDNQALKDRQLVNELLEKGNAI